MKNIPFHALEGENVLNLSSMIYFFLERDNIDNDKKASVRRWMNMWITPEQIALELSVSYPTVCRWLQNGRIPAHKIIGQWRIRRADFVKWLEERSNQ